MHLLFPVHEPRLRNLDATPEVWDPFRQKWVAFTPEEWVRQNLLQYLVQTCGVPPKLMAIEKSFQLGKLSKRADVLVYRNEKPWLLVECKAQSVNLTQEVVQQVLAYHSVVQAPYLVISNGEQTFCFQQIDQGWKAQDNLPHYNG